ncbi:isopentenyl-diphosphate Delta-isomerase [Microbacterium sorbitolivorans]|uniref:Isopentenyl-diphosphate Delta-isomerase n=1 Tax=Microbacterium sorbitolivorans TaxID=1867410 RepID=A0A367Y2V1_9MICO|nr:isopentenyl-diphosphate Delta-isomerase [Microbacterium sorbitolivorans]RCK60158.1 isopentenyl-diphosphate Delta-isomerase [Microbacterium sorbitolivorans]GGF48311.1 isopentenyl-diphosphate Delta-isomerase [Microbacterium sorbitolivorans]
MTTHERVVLLNDDGASIGAADKGGVHHAETPLHLAFSCYVFDPSGERILVTRRALTKRTWPGTWTNSFCGHPQPFEPIGDAVVRRASHELGMELTGLRLALPEFRYRAIDASGIVENEICPVYIATAASDPLANPDEVMDLTWVRTADLLTAARATPWAFSPWLVEQLELLSLVAPEFASVPEFAPLPALEAQP